MYREVGEPSISGRSFRPLTPERIKEIKESEDIAYNAKTNADFNFQRRTSVANWANEIRFANGDGKELERMINCQRCVVAHEARMRGYDVIAQPSWGREDPLQRVGNWLEVFEKDGREIYNCVGSNAAEIEKFINNKMNEWGKNSRAFVWFDWEKPAVYLGKGHVIVAQLNENGFLQFGDPQAKKIGAARCLNSAEVGSVIIMRVDNLKFTDIVKRCCKNKGTTI